MNVSLPLTDNSDIFTGFENREKDLRNITRYSLYAPMYYRTNVWGHSRRVSWIVHDFAPAVKDHIKDFNPLRAEAMALVHNDAEIFLGDIQSGIKAKMTAEQLANVEDRERKATEKICLVFPKTFCGFSYQELLQEAMGLTTPEARLVKYADRMDALCEALHEIFAGNETFVTNVINEYGTIPTPTEHYAPYFLSFPSKYPELQTLFNPPTHAWFAPLPIIDYRAIPQNRQPYTLSSLQESTDYPHYEAWKKITMRYGTREEVDKLTHQKELSLPFESKRLTDMGQK